MSTSEGRAGRRGALGLAAALALATTSGAIAASGCASAPRSGETLIESVRTYHEGIRWQRYTAAAGRIPPRERAAFLDEWDERSQDLKITDYEIVDLAAQGDTARVQVKISWYGDREGTLHDTHARQIWHRRGKVWLLTDEVRMRGPAMPGLAEPAEDAEGAEGAEGEKAAAGDGSSAAGQGGDSPVAAPTASGEPQLRAAAANQ